MVKVREEYPLMPDGSLNIGLWLTRFRHDRSQADFDFIQKACELASSFGKDIKTPYQISCLHQGILMAELLNDMGMDKDSIATVLVYEAYRYCNLKKDLIQKELGKEVVDLLDELHKINALNIKNYSDPDKVSNRGQYLDNLRHMLLTAVEDVRVVILKLVLHTCEMRAVTGLGDEIRRKLAKETMEIYSPLANRLGIGQLKWELEDLSFRFLEPATYKNIARMLDERRIDRERYIDRVKTNIKNALKEQQVEAVVHGRVKHIYSIWKKMLRKMVSYHEIYDVRAIRVVVNEVKDCYAALGVIHTLWQHIPKEFDDYIANPKTNGYQSLHTAVVGPEGRVLEIQIRTNSMHERAELGVAAHWRYKEGGTHDKNFQEKISNLRQILKWHSQLGDSESSLEDFRAELFNDRVYVFTPAGDVINLPQGATALDFAYHIHTEIGHRCRGAKQNGKMIPLTQPIRNGAQIEVLTAKHGGPSRDWLNPSLKYVKTAKARVKIQHWFKHQDRKENINAGRSLYQRELKRLGFEPISIDLLLNQFKQFSTEDDFFSAIGVGDIRLTQISGALQRIIPKEGSPKQAFSSISFQKSANSSKSTEIIVGGVGNLLCHMARCCRPVSGDEIVGYITIGRGVSVHRKDCQNILQSSEAKKNRLIEVAWGECRNNLYEVHVEIRAYERQSLLKDITALLAHEKINVQAINTLNHKMDHVIIFYLTLEVAGIESLSKALARLHQVQNIIEVRRVMR